MRQFYIVDRVTGAVVNGVYTAKSLEQLQEDPFYDTDKYYVTETPAMDKLMQYEFWNERP